MKGLYLRCSTASEDVAAIHRLLGLDRALTPTPLAHCQICIEAADWPNGATQRSADGRLILIGAGLAIIDQKLGWPADFADRLAAVAPSAMGRLFQDLDFGSFIALVARPEGVFAITDPFGLAAHYWESGPDGPRLAPSLWFLARDRTPDPSLQAFLETRQYLVGNLTPYPGIQRLMPGAVTDLGSGDHWRWFDYGGGTFCPERFLQAIKAPWVAFGDRPSVLPLSGGLDSRLLLTCRDHSYGLTFGPAESGDRPVARRFADRFQTYDAFSLFDLDLRATDKTVADRLVFGSATQPNAPALATFRRPWQKLSGQAPVVFDGYLGDVLQRGSYFGHRGVTSRAARLLPELTFWLYTPPQLLERRHLALSPEHRALVMTQFKTLRDFMNVEDWHAMLLFEILFGRGGRWMSTGSLFPHQYLTTVMPFYAPAAFRTLFAASAPDMTSFRVLEAIWRRLPEAVSKVPTPEGVVPRWPHRIAKARLFIEPLLRLIGRGAGPTYATERARLRWPDA